MKITKQEIRMDEKNEINEAVTEEVKTADKKKKSAKQAEIEALKAEMEALKTEAKEKDDKYLRLAAEYDNFRRRSREEKDATYSTAMADTVAELLPIIDNLERAASFDDGEKVREGLKMIASTVSASLGKLGVEAFGEAGDKFDPNLHNAVLHDEDDTDREGEITDVYQKGYKKGSKIIRFAMVKTVN
jgi:molecular chaperone GrpE